MLDLHGVTGPVPDESVFYPPLDKTALVPARGYGAGLGAHVYLFNLGSARVGIGASLLNIRATAKRETTPTPAGSGTGGTTAITPANQGLQIDLRILAPQISFNFGGRGGWSYLSAGAGLTDITGQTTQVQAGRRETSGLRSLNFGGGARWFMKSHLAFGFDLRIHRVSGGEAGAAVLAAPPPTTDPGVIPAPIPAPLSTPGMMFLTLGAGISIR